MGSELVFRLRKNFYSRRGSGQQFLLRKSGVGGGDQDEILKTPVTRTGHEVYLSCPPLCPPKSAEHVVFGACPLCCKNMCCASRFCTGGGVAAGSRSEQCPRARKAKC